MALSWQHSSPIFRPNRHFGSITALLPIFPHYYHHYYLLDRHYYIHYYPVITTLFPIITVIMSPLLLIITSVITQLLLIITSVITSLLHIITKSLSPNITVIMSPLLLIITRSIICNNGLLPIIDLGNLQMLDCASKINRFQSVPDKYSDFSCGSWAFRFQSESNHWGMCKKFERVINCTGFTESVHTLQCIYEGLRYSQSSADYVTLNPQQSGLSTLMMCGYWQGHVQIQTGSWYVQTYPGSYLQVFEPVSACILVSI